MTQRFARAILALALIFLPLHDLGADMSDLQSLRQERKFAPTAMYTGPDTPEDGPQLIALVNGAIDGQCLSLNFGFAWEAVIAMSRN